MERPKVILGRRASEGLNRGAHRLAYLLGLTLGPVAGTVVNYKDTGSDRCEMLTDAATIARRIIQLPDAAEDPGAMLLRQLVWRVRQKAGDGSATAAVLALAMLREARRVIAAGANPMLVRQGIDLGVAAAVKALQEMAVPVQGQDALAALATASCGNPELGRIVGEIFDTLGPDGVVNVQDYMGYYLDREYIEGCRFRGTFTSRFFLTDTNYRLVQLVRPYVFICDWNLTEMAQVAPLLELVLQKGDKRPLLVISSSQDGGALSTLLANHQKGVLQCCGVTLKGYGDAHRAALDDMALVTGGRFLYRDAKMDPHDVTLEDLGQAERIEVSEEYVTVFEGAGDRKAIRQRRQLLKAKLEEAKDRDEYLEIRERINRLSGGIAILKVGAPTDDERKRRREQAEEVVKLVADGCQAGIVPGGGAAYLACIPAVKAVRAEGEAAFGVAIVARALEEPMRRIVANAGLDPSAAVARVQERGAGFGVDVHTRQVVDMREVGIMDSVRVAQTALETAASGVNMIITTGAVVLTRKPVQRVEP